MNDTVNTIIILIQIFQFRHLMVSGTVLFTAKHMLNTRVKYTGEQNLRSVFYFVWQCSLYEMSLAMKFDISVLSHSYHMTRASLHKQFYPLTALLPTYLRTSGATLVPSNSMA